MAPCPSSELLWSTARSKISRPVVQCAPSWSWASVDGEISPKWCPSSLQGSITTIYRNVVPVSLSALYGSINSVISYLKVEGQMKEFGWAQFRQYLKERRFEDEQYSEDWPAKFCGYPDVGCSQADASESIPIDKGGRIRIRGLIVLEHPIRGLILVPAGANGFRRAGVFFRLCGSGPLGFETRSRHHNCMNPILATHIYGKCGPFLELINNVMVSSSPRASYAFVQSSSSSASSLRGKKWRLWVTPRRLARSRNTTKATDNVSCVPLHGAK